MKSLKYLKLALFALVIGLSATSCMDDDWTDPTGEVAPFGNNQLQETNVVNIADLKSKYSALQQDSHGIRHHLHPTFHIAMKD